VGTEPTIALCFSFAVRQQVNYNQLVWSRYMRSIGLRAEPEGFNWAVCEGSLEVPVLVASDRVAAPANYSTADALNFFRTRVLQLVDQHHPTLAGLRTPETIARANESAKKRLRVEGVLLAASAEAGIKTVSGALTTLSSRLGVKSAKVLLDSKEYRGIDWNKLTKEKRESVLMGVSLLESE
jgi:hypothetical protein